MKILVVEPHPDDAFLSLGWHLEHIWAEHERTILTVYANEKRTQEAANYAQAIGANSICLRLQETKMLAVGEKVRVIPELRAMLEDLITEHEYGMILFPLGLQHPDHYNVAASRYGGVMRYLEVPYLTKLKLAEEVNTRCSGKRIESICFPPKRKWRHAEIFKSQAKFFHFNPLHEKTPPEVVVY